MKDTNSLQQAHSIVKRLCIWTLQGITIVLCKFHAFMCNIIDRKFQTQITDSCVVRNASFLYRLKMGQIPQSVKQHLTRFMAFCQVSLVI